MSVCHRICGLFLVTGHALWGGCEPVRPRVSDAGQARFGPSRQVSLGLCEDYPEETRSLAEARRDFAVLEAAGVDTLRVSIGWDGVERQKDRYDFAFWDAFVELAVDAGVTLIPYVAYTPEWNSDGSPETFWKTPPRDPGELTELMQQLAERYRGRIHSWEIWNEPDNKDYWLGSVQEFATLLAAGAEGVRAGDPQARLVLGGLAGGVGFLRELFEAPGVAERVDVINLHGYYETWNPNPLETFPEYIGEVAEIVARHAGQQAIWMAEVGYSNFAPPPGAPVGALYPYEHTPEFQAVMLVRTLALLLAEPAVSLIAWYELKDARAADAVIGDAHNRHLGVTFVDHRPKPALAALAFVSELFGGGFRSVDRGLRLEGSPATTPVLRAFVTVPGQLVLVAWLPTHVAAAPSPSTGSLRVDSRRELVRVAFPERALGPATFHDATGRVLGAQAVRDNGRESELELELRGGEVRVVRIPIEVER